MKSSNPGELPDYGAIFMSNKTTKKECFSRKLLGLPIAQAGFVSQVKSGMILFLFEFEKRELHGVFLAVSDGALNIVPHAYSSSGKQFPAQVKFEQVWHCNPLKEIEFRDAIRENYFSKFKFNFGLSDRQVRRLLVLFSSRKIENSSLRMYSPSSKLPREIDFGIDKAINEEPENFVKLQNDGRLGMINFRDSADNRDFINSPRGRNDYSSSPSAVIGNTHRVDTKVGSLILDKQIGDFFGEIRRSIGDRAVISETAEFEHNMNLEAQRPYASNTSSTDHSCFAPGYGMRNANEDGMGVPSYVPNLPSLYVPYVPNYKGASNLLNSVPQPSFSPSDFVYPDRSNMISPMPTYPEFEARKTLGSNNSWDTPLGCIPFCEGGVSQTPNKGDKDLSSSKKDHPVLLDNNDLNPMYSYRKYKLSVFDRLSLPSETSDECDWDSSVNKIMEVLHQNHYQWMETESSKPLNSVRKRGIKRKKILNSNELNDPEAKASKEMAVAANDVADHEKSQLLAAEEIHFLDFKRRSKVKNTHDDAVTVDSNDLSLGQPKRKKLIRPKFHNHDIDGSSNNGSKPSENAGLPLVMFHDALQVKNFDAGDTPDHCEYKVQNCEGNEATENCNKSLSKEDEDRKETSQHVATQNVFSPVSCKDEVITAEYLSMGGTQAVQNFESLRNAKVDDREGTSEKNDVLDVFLSVSGKSEGKNADERFSLGTIPELQNGGSMRNTNQDGKEQSEKNDVTDYVGYPNPEKVSSLDSSEAGKLIHLHDYACYTISQELSSALSTGERPERGLEIIEAHNHDVEDTKQLL